MSWFKQWPKKTNGKRAVPSLSEKQKDLIMSDFHVYNIVWCDLTEKYVLYKGFNLRNILWNHTNG
jgi:hypothetical protein